LFPDGHELKLKFTRGKVVNAVGAYHIHTQVADDSSFRLLRGFVDGAPDGFLFPLRSGYQRQALLSELRLALRHSRPLLELRSLRRGSLQLLAHGGASEDELLAFSRHTTAQQLRRYLGFESVPHAAQRSGVAKAVILADGLAGGSPREFSAPGVQICDWLSVSSDGDVILSRDRVPHLSSDQPDRSHYALLAKPQTTEPADLPEVDQLSTEGSTENSVDVCDAWFQARRFLTDADGMHTSVPWNRRVRTALLRPGDIAKLLEIRNVAPVEASQQHKIKGTIQVFLTPEDAKSRYRVIKHPVDYNNRYGRDTLLPTENSTKHSARHAILRGEGSITIDLVAEFDQLLLDEAVSWCQVFRADSRLFRNLRLPMGGRHSTSIGTAFLRVLLDFVMPAGVSVDWATDAARFTGPREAVIEAAWTFVQRCRRVRAKANEIDCATATRDDVAALYRTEGADFLGEVADYTAKTVQCRARHVEKLRAYYARSFRSDCTFAELFGLYGLLYYMSDTLALRVDKRLRTRLFYSDLARRLAADPSLWTAPARVSPPADIGAWVADALENRPASVVPVPCPDAVVFGDACRLGYAGIVVRRRSDGLFSTVLLQHRWPQRQSGTVDYTRSTVSEPEASVRLLGEASKLYPGAKFVYVTDHEPFVGAVARGFSVSPGYNSRVGRLLDSHPFVQFIYEPGESMLADRYSRFEASSLSDSDRKAAEVAAAAILDASACRGNGDTIANCGVGRGCSVVRAPKS
jgi:hypothetical protein